KNRSSGLEYTAMSAIEALKAARAAGVELALDGDDLALRAASAPPAAVLDALSRPKAAIVALLRPWGDGWLGQGGLAFFDGRARIAEFDGGLPREEAEARAFECCAVEWLNRNLIPLLAMSLPRQRWQHLTDRPSAAACPRRHIPGSTRC